jgi:hypothetical protein
MTEHEAIAIARENALRHGWRFAEPVRAEFRRRWLLGRLHWLVVSNDGMRGGSTRTEIDHETGEILSAACNPR